MYGKVFDSIFDSTLVADGGWLPTYIFMSMISLADKHGHVEIAPKAMYRRIGLGDHEPQISFEAFEGALHYLMKPDPGSRSAAEEGRRIIPLSQVDGFDGNRGYLLVNYKWYCEQREAEARRRADRERKQAERSGRRIN